MSDYYSVLGVSRGAEATEIRQVYLKLAKENHPDRFADPVEKARADEFFKGLTAAYNTLSSERKRKEYDAEIDKPKFSGPVEIGRDAYARGLEAYEGHDYQAAVELFRTAVHHQPQEGGYQAALGKALGKNPQWARQAIDALEAAVQLEPANGAFHADLARLFHAQGLRLRAKKSAETAQRLLPDDRSVQKLLGAIGDGDTPGSGGEAGGLLGLLRKKP
jgi:curved DNA-binding protein CbpA